MEAFHDAKLIYLNMIGYLLYDPMMYIIGARHVCKIIFQPNK